MGVVPGSAEPAATLLGRYRYDGLHRRVAKLIPGDDWNRHWQGAA